MSIDPTVQPARKKRMPRWMMIVLAAFSVLFVLGAIFGKPAQEQQNHQVATAPAPTSSPSAPPSTAAPDTYRVLDVVDADTVKLSGPSGERIVSILGVRIPENGSGCFTEEALSWAKNTLAGQEVTIQTVSEDTAAGIVSASISLVNGGDYSTAAIKAGYAKYANQAVDSTFGAALQAAENVAKAAQNGLWGPPCLGNIDTPPTTAAPAPVAAAPTPAEPTTKKSTPPPAAPEPDEPASAYYPNCAAARAAGVAPLHVGEPGYSRKLDRDGDGVACE